MASSSIFKSILSLLKYPSNIKYAFLKHLEKEAIYKLNYSKLKQYYFSLKKIKFFNTEAIFFWWVTFWEADIYEI